MGYCQEVSVKILMPWFVCTIWYSVAPWRGSERKLLQLCYLLFTSPSKALTRGHCSGEEGKKKYSHSQHSGGNLLLSSVVKTETVFVVSSLLMFLYLFSICAHLSLYSNMSASAVRICITQSPPSTTQGPHFCRPTLPPICQCSRSQLPPNEPVFVWTFSVAFELILSIS